MFSLKPYMNKKEEGPYMTVKEVATALNLGTTSIRKAISELHRDRDGVFETKNNQGGYLLNEAEVTLIKKHIEKNPYVDSLTLPKTELEESMIILQAQNILKQRIEKLEAQAEENRPKVEFYEAVTDSKDAIDIGTMAKVLNVGVGRNKLFKILRDNHILMKNNIPYQRYIDSGWFRTIEQKYSMPDGSTRINIKTVVYQKGVNGIRMLLAEKYNLGPLTGRIKPYGEGEEE